jgi:hypothetical protein
MIKYNKEVVGVYGDDLSNTIWNPSIWQILNIAYTWESICVAFWGEDEMMGWW